MLIPALLSCLKRYRRLAAFTEMVLIWSVHLKSSRIVTPRSFTVLTLLKNTPSISTGVNDGGDLLKHDWISLHLHVLGFSYNSRFQSISYLVSKYNPKGCLHESRDGTIDGTGWITGSWFTYACLIDFTIRLHGGGTFFIPSRQAGIPVMPTGIPAKAGRSCSYKHFVPHVRDGIVRYSGHNTCI